MANSAPPCFFQNSVSAEAENVAVSSATTENSEVLSAASEFPRTMVNSPGGSPCPSPSREAEQRLVASVAAKFSGLNGYAVTPFASSHKESSAHSRSSSSSPTDGGLGNGSCRFGASTTWPEAMEVHPSLPHRSLHAYSSCMSHVFNGRSRNRSVPWWTLLTCEARGIWRHL